MKKFFLMLGLVALVAVSCDKDPVMIEVPIQLTMDGNALAIEGVPVTLTSATANLEATTDASGKVVFTVPVGNYTATASFKKAEAGIQMNYNGTTTVNVVDLGKGSTFPPVPLAITASKSSQLIIKEVYNGGCADNAGKLYQYDKYIIVYNNSDTEVDASKMCLAMAQILNTTATNKYTITDGVIEYETAGWVPASYGIWWFQNGVSVKIAPYSQIVISINGAIDHTATYTNSVNLSNADFCLYDLESGFNMAAHYPAPAATVPTSHYMKTVEFGMGTAWAFPNKNAAPMLLMPDQDIKAFVADPANFDNRGNNNSSNYAKVPISWVLDAMEIWSSPDETKYFRRLPNVIDNGYVVMETNGQGHSWYRNVDKAATEAIEGNAGKLVYNYAGAVAADATDPSGIDAEASIAAGAKIVYSDTNNTAKDFHFRNVASLKK
ncbi:MAG: DUF4876 domain-containing protein [Bacteroidales bacterium]|nr:DUF4876 domain-containing protein [Bacteroidales bacterium]